MDKLGLILLVFAFVFATIQATFNLNPYPFGRWHMGWLAVACWILAEIIGGASKLFH